MSNLVTLLSQPALATWLVKATALLVAALAATALLRRASAGTRHLVWVGTLAGILLLPALSLWTPVRLAIIPSSLARLTWVTPASDKEPGAAAVVVARLTSAAPTGGIAEIAVTGRTTTPSLATSSSRASSSPDERHFPLWTTLLLVWGLISVVLLGWLGFGALSVRRIVRSGRPLDDDRSWSAPLCEIADRLDLDAVPKLLASPLIEMPFACGVLEPTVVLPSSAEQWSDSRRRAVLFHELAHVKRRDLLGHTLGRLACVFYWFHPLVWTAARRLRAESERACDDLVLSCGARASDYADHLLDIVISVRRYGAPATAMPMARRRELEGRVLAILDPAVQRIGPGRLQSLGLVGTLGVLALCLAAMTPRRVVPEGGRGMRDLEAAVNAASPMTRHASSATQSMVPQDVAHGVEVKRSLTLARIAEREPIADPAPTATPAPSPAPSTASASDSSLSHALGTIANVAVRAAASAIVGATKGQTHVDSTKVALLLKVLRSDQDASVRKMAAWGLSEAGDAPEVVDALIDALRHDDDADVREMSAWALSDSHRAAARGALAQALSRDESDNVRETAAWALGQSGGDDGRDALEAALTSDPSPDVRETAAWGLGYSPRQPAPHALLVALNDKSDDVRETAAWALAETHDEDTAPGIAKAFIRETNGDVRTAELRALTLMHVDDKDVLDEALASKDADLRARAVRMLAGAGSDSWPEPRPRPRPRPMP